MIREDEFRKNADEGRQQAEKSFNLLDKQRRRKVAQHRLQIAPAGRGYRTGGTR